MHSSFELISTFSWSLEHVKYAIPVPFGHIFHCFRVIPQREAKISIQIHRKQYVLGFIRNIQRINFQFYAFIKPAKLLVVTKVITSNCLIKFLCNFG
ncbi:hypothetical protein D1006_34700 [Burkholderia stabilis]|uniref:Uncharacterized protein n=1 Tax=Burkholderia stabilis TaxID=95485 RepID=A0A4Q2A888_9BURK|nr:hypothetical protein D1006_34700 [Burkholderia stabilis]